MRTEKIRHVIALYQQRFRAEGILKRRTNLTAPFVSRDDMLAHAHYLTDGILEYAGNPDKVGKTGRHLGSLQTLLMVAGWYTLEEVMHHNKPD